VTSLFLENLRVFDQRLVDGYFWRIVLLTVLL
jgi:hypothetical protein